MIKPMSYLSIGFVAGLAIGALPIFESGVVESEPVSQFTAEEAPYIPSSVPVWHENPKWKQDSCKRFNDCKLLAEAIVYEARSESKLGQSMVASVILNRVDNPTRWGFSISEVIKQPAQFSYLDDMHLQSTPTQSDWDMALEIAHDLLFGLSERTTDGTHYHTTSVNPSWSNSLIKIGVVGNHIFYE